MIIRTVYSSYIQPEGGFSLEKLYCLMCVAEDIKGTVSQIINAWK
jgi:hypothetical protein